MRRGYAPPARRGRALKRTALALLLLLLAAGFSVTLYVWLAERAQPTVAGWRAHVVTLAGDGAPGSGRSAAPAAAAAAASFQDPFGIAVDRKGHVYVSDAGGNNRILRIAPDNSMATLAGGGAEGYADGQGTAAAFHTPSAIAADVAGNLYVADTGNNRIRKITPEGMVTTLAGDGTPGLRDGAAGAAQFNGPVGIALDALGNVYVADTYNDRIRLITADGQVTTLAGSGHMPGYQDGAATTAALFDTPCAVAAAATTGELYVADTGNNRIRRLTKDGQVATLEFIDVETGAPGEVAGPLGLALTHDGFLYVTEKSRGQITQIAPDGAARKIAGTVGVGFADGDGLTTARFNSPAGVAVDRRGALYVADGANYLVRKLTPAAAAAAGDDGAAGRREVPRLSAETLGVDSFPWPLDPQQQWHEVVATLGEVRGSYDGESRHHLHSGIDIYGGYGATVRAVYDEKVTSPLSNWGFGGLNEGLRVGVMAYIHLRVGRNERDEMLAGGQFQALSDDAGKVTRVRIKRGARFRVGDPLGTINRMYHVHLNFGPPNVEINPLALPLANFSDAMAPTIERDGIQLFDSSGARLTEKRSGRLIVRGETQIIVDAYDQVDRNLARRRLGLYKLGYQILRADGTPAPGFAEPRITILFDRLAPDPEAVKIAYADHSGITVYGSARTRFLYVVTNTVRDGQAFAGRWNPAELPPGNYVLRIIAADYAGNEAEAGRDLPITIEP